MGRGFWSKKGTLLMFTQKDREQLSRLLSLNCAEHGNFDKRLRSIESTLSTFLKPKPKLREWYVKLPDGTTYNISGTGWYVTKGGAVIITGSETNPAVLPAGTTVIAGDALGDQ
jgi:hypothetical protein